MTIFDLQPGTEYRVLVNIVDFYGNVFQSGQRLRFIKRVFLPYDDGHTVVFQEIQDCPVESVRELKMYLQGDDQRNVIEQTDLYLQINL